MSIDAQIRIRRNDFEFNVDLSIADGDVLAVLGPNGSGKSTLLNALAGLQPIDEGTIALNDTVVDAVEDSIFVLPEKRNIGVVFQSNTLFENLSVLENVAFGLRARGTNRAVARTTAHEWLERLSLQQFSDRRPSQLSGGQAQRVSLARALAPRPRLLLLDEPTSALDIRAKAEIRRDLQRLRREHPVTTVIVTHDPLDAFALADGVLVLEEGKVVQSGDLDEVASHPQSRHIADMVGLSLVRGIVRDGVLVTPSGVEIFLPADTPSGPTVAAIRPASVALHRSRPEGSARNAWQMTVTDLDRHPDRVRVRLGGPISLLSELTPAGANALSLTLADNIWVSVKASEITATPDLDS